ncbi:MAG: hypothetical protein EA378_03615 [Phycisphaerales bacterium]|nr:MAG: hypothetical protein EA378_03615 [Phycisphaerales bacterium]
MTLALWTLGPTLIAAGRAIVGGDADLAALAPSLGLLARSIGVAAFVAGLAVLLAIPAAAVWSGAWGGVGRRRWLAAIAPGIVLAPVLLPGYIAYAGLNVIRGPGMWLGDWLGRIGSEGVTWAPVLAGRSLAVLGLALWAWPIAALVLGSAARSVGPGPHEALRLESRGPRRWVALASMHRGALLASFGLLLVVALGSAVPLHVAQVDTYAIRVWLELALAGPDRAWRVLASSWPMVLLAGAVGLWAAVRAERSLGRDEDDLAGRAPPRPRALWGGIAMGVLSLGVPIALLIWAVRDPAAWGRFWPAEGGAVRASVETGAILAVFGAGLTLLSMAACGGGRGSGLWRAVAVGLAVGLAATPGVILGAGAVEVLAWTRAAGVEVPRAVERGPWIVVVAHAARFAFLPVLAGVWLAAAEPRALVDLRRLDGASGVRGIRGWCRAAAWPVLGPVLGVGVLMGVLSAHEVEAAVIVSPPGRDALARRMLDALHFARLDDLSVAAVWMVGLTAAPLLLAGALAMLGAGRRRFR